MAAAVDDRGPLAPHSRRLGGQPRPGIAHPGWPRTVPCHVHRRRDVGPAAGGRDAHPPRHRRSGSNEPGAGRVRHSAGCRPEQGHVRQGRGHGHTGRTSPVASCPTSGTCCHHPAGSSPVTRCTSVSGAWTWSGTTTTVDCSSTRSRPLAFYVAPPSPTRCACYLDCARTTWPDRFIGLRLVSTADHRASLFFPPGGEAVSLHNTHYVRS